MSSGFSSLSPRERGLLVLTVALVSSVATLGLVYQGFDHLRTLDRRIASSEQELLNLQTQTLQSRSVDAAFREVVSEHSTAMTKGEIHDSLRREIYRLALKNPDLSESEQAGTGKDRNLVVIPGLREGVLREKGEGYREYQIRFRVPSCSVLAAREFLKRLEQSQLLLRIDSFEMTRSHSSTRMSLTIEVTRTVLSDVEIGPADENLAGWDAAELHNRFTEIERPKV